MSEYSIAGVRLDSPLVNAAGSINGTNEESILREVEDLGATGIGAVTIGSFTVPRQEGNEAKFGSPTYHHDLETGETFNAMGLPNVGVEAAKRLMPQVVLRAHDYGKKVIASVSSTLHSEEHGDSKKQLSRLVYEMLLTGVDLIEVNTSSPNTVTSDGGRKPIIGYDLETMEEITEELAMWAGTTNSKVGVKLPPYLTVEQQAVAKSLATIFTRQRTFGFITTSNTIGGHIPQSKDGKPILSVPGGMGGMSGPATKQVGREQLIMWHDLVGKDLDVVSTLGVDSGSELKTRLELGAAAAGGVTFLWGSSNWRRTITKILEEFAQDQA